jgi:hypothetical protein
MMEISVAGEEGCLLSPGDGGDHAVDQSPGRDTRLPAAAVDTHRAVEVAGCIKVVKVKSKEKTAKISLPGVAARLGQDLHDYWLGNGDGALARDQL